MNSKTSLRLAAAFAATFALASAVRATVLWSATSPSSFRSLEEQDCDGNYHSTNGSTQTVVSDPVYGNVIQFHKVSTDRRCEGKGSNTVTITSGTTYYIGWRFKMSNTVNDNCIFQWKSYGSPMNQNYPLVLKMINGKITLQYYPPNSSSTTTLFSATVSAKTWYSIALKVKVSDSTTGGNVQVWWGNSSTPVTLATGGTSFTGKTFDGNEINPKWGKYGACGTTIDSYVGQLKIGTTLDDVFLGTGGGGGGTSATFEAENLTVTNSGTGTSIQSDANSSGGKWVSLDAENTGSWMEFTTPSMTAGTYQLSMMWKGNTTRGIAGFAIDGAAVGGALDQYSSAQTYPTSVLGTVTFGSAGTHKIRLSGTGKNSASSSYILSADKFIFTAQ
jgi:hypothetical protein